MTTVNKINTNCFGPEFRDFARGILRTNPKTPTIAILGCIAAMEVGVIIPITHKTIQIACNHAITRWMRAYTHQNRGRAEQNMNMFLNNLMESHQQEFIEFVVGDPHMCKSNPKLHIIDNFLTEVTDHVRY